MGAGTGAIKELFAAIGLDFDETGFRAAEAAIGVLQDGLLGIGAAVATAAAALGALVTSTQNDAKEIDLYSQRLGISKDVLQEFAYAGQLSGVSMEEVAVALGHLARTGVKDLRKGMLDLADEFQKMPNGGEKVVTSFYRLGRSGQRLIPMLNHGRDGLASLGQEAHDLGRVMSDEMVAAGVRAADAQTRLWAALKGVGYAIAGPLLENAAKFSEALMRWVSAHRQVIAAGIHKAITLISEAAKVLWRLMQPLIATFSLLTKHAWILWAAVGALSLAFLSSLGAAIGSAVVAIGGMIAALAELTLAELAAAALPFIAGLAWFALAAIIALVAEDVYRFFTGGESLLGHFIDKFKEIFPSWHDVWTTAFTWWKKELDKLMQYFVDKLTGGAGHNLFGQGFRTFIQMQPNGAGVLAAWDERAGGGKSPAASVANSVASSSSNVVAPQLNATINVTPGQGADAQAAASVTMDALSDWWDTKWREVAAAVTF